MEKSVDERGPWREVVETIREHTRAGAVWVMRLDCRHVARQVASKPARRRKRCAECYRETEREVERIRARIEAALDRGELPDFR